MNDDQEILKTLFLYAELADEAKKAGNSILFELFQLHIVDLEQFLGYYSFDKEQKMVDLSFFEGQGFLKFN